MSYVIVAKAIVLPSGMLLSLFTTRDKSDSSFVFPAEMMANMYH